MPGTALSSAHLERLTPNQREVLHTYLEAKDAQRPSRFAKVFTDDATFQSRFLFETDFASEEPARGLSAVAGVFREMGRQVEDIYTVYTPSSIAWAKGALTIDWLVGMTERGTGNQRLAWGDYAWRFNAAGDRATELVVVMHRMVSLPAKDAASRQRIASIQDWLAALPAPWCAASMLTGDVPEFEGAADMRAFFARND